MKMNQKLSFRLLGGLAVMALLAGCALKQKPSDSKGAGTDSQGNSLQQPGSNGPGWDVRQLELFAVPPERNEFRPQTLPDGGRPLARVAQNQSIVLTENLVLPAPEKGKPGELYLVFRESQGAAKIIQAHYQHRKRDRINQIERSFGKESLNFDPDRRLWFLSLAELAGGTHGWKEGPEITHELFLDLFVEGQPRKEVSLQFNLSVPLPEGLGATEIRTLSFPATPEEMVQAWSGEGIRVAEGTLMNPLLREAAFYLRVEEVQPFRTQTDSWMRHIPQGRPGAYIAWVGSGEALGPYTHDSHGALQVRKLRVVRKTGKSEILTVGTGGWVSVPVLAEEQVSIAWLATEDPDRPLCPLPSRAPDPESGPNQRFEGYDREWKYHNARLTGSMRWEARLADRGIKPEQVNGELKKQSTRPWVSVTRFEPLAVNWFAGQQGVGRIAWECRKKS